MTAKAMESQRQRYQAFLLNWTHFYSGEQMERSPFFSHPRAARERDDSGEYEYVIHLEKGYMFQLLQLLSYSGLKNVDIVDVQMLYNKWWKNTGDVCTRQDKSKDSKVSDQAT